MRAMTLRLPDEVHEALRREAFESRRSMNDLVLEALTDRAQVWDEGFYKATALVGGDFWADGWDDAVNPYREGSK